MKHYPKIKRLSSLKDLEMMFKDVEKVEITEKIDGSNASFSLNELDNSKIDCFSRKTELNKNNTLNGFYNWVQDNVLLEIDKLNPNYIYFGEWLVKHRIKYNDECYKKFYLFDIYDRKKDRWLNSYEKTVEFCKLRHIKDIKRIATIEVGGNSIIENDYKLLDDYPDAIKINESNEFEGIVIKIFDKLYNGEPCFFKLVNPKFEEVKMKSKKQNKDTNNSMELVKRVCTKNRIYKIIYKLLDNGILNKNDLQIENMKNLIKVIIPKVQEDIFEEEIELIKSCQTNYIITDKEIKTSINKIAPRYIINFINGVD